MAAGISGVPLGSWISGYLRRTIHDGDPLICAFGLLISAPLVYLALISITTSELLAYFLIFFGMVTVNMCWSIVADILLVITKIILIYQFSVSVYHLYLV